MRLNEMTTGEAEAWQAGLEASPLHGIVRWFEKAVPAPTSKNLHTQLGCHFEEMAEMIDTLTPSDAETAVLLMQAKDAVRNLADHLKAGDRRIRLDPQDHVELLDALCDQVVTATGVGHMLSFQTLDALQEVNASNWSKFVDGQPVFDANRKIQKGPAYFKADLARFVAVPVD